MPRRAIVVGSFNWPPKRISLERFLAAAAAPLAAAGVGLQFVGEVEDAYVTDLRRRYPGVEGTAYFIGGLGVNYQKADDIILAPIRAGVGMRLGANVGYLAYSRQRNLFPF